ncbi:MAG: class I SAM-dependent methyltransferase [Xanthomonadales bacterium]|nr:class I SAM-dependent methyltransferase [Xanthomonadales bacterium]
MVAETRSSTISAGLLIPVWDEFMTSDNPKIIRKKSYQQAVLEIYDAPYAAFYPTYWNEGCTKKNLGNLQCIHELLDIGGNWLDLCCGTAWHFSMVSTPCQKTGLDLSPAQLSVARADHPECRFLQGDVLEIEPIPEYDLVTSFWMAYGYLDDVGMIEQFCKQMVAWLKPGGNLILEVGDGQLASTWNTTHRAASSIFRVFKRTDDWLKWSFFDVGGVHNLTTPPYSFFDEVLGPYFHAQERRFDTNWCGLGRK